MDKILYRYSSTEPPLLLFVWVWLQKFVWVWGKQQTYVWRGQT